MLVFFLQVILFDSQEDDPELQHYCHRVSRIQIYRFHPSLHRERRVVLMLLRSTPNRAVSGLSPGWVHCVVFLGKTLPCVLLKLFYLFLLDNLIVRFYHANQYYRNRWSHAFKFVLPTAKSSFFLRQSINETLLLRIL